MPFYAVATFSGAFLLFQIQPLSGKYILPWFGGGPGVWTTCLLFFQVLLVAGYAYAHWLGRQRQIRTQALVHFCLLGLALCFLPVVPSVSWKPQGDADPVSRIVLLLGATLGVPYLALASTSPLLQQWSGKTHTTASPYRLYAVSNAGSLLGLLSYPFVFENHFTRRTQAQLWSAGFVLYVLCCCICLQKLWRGSTQRAGAIAAQAPDCGKEALGAFPEQVRSVSTFNLVLWVLLPAGASGLLLATTNKLCQDVAAMPLLWVIPLSLYLLSFVICFDSSRWYRRGPFGVLMVVSIGAVCWALFKGAEWTLWKQVSILCAGLFACCMVAHGELYRLRPGPERLTLFYLLVATGGAVGGIFVAVIAPAIFKGYYELHWCLWICYALFTVIFWVRSVCAQVESEPLEASNWECRRLASELGGAEAWNTPARRRRSQGDSRVVELRRLAGASLWLGIVVLGMVLWLQARRAENEIVASMRNFYGVLTVYEHRKTEPKAHHLLLQHGRITHGLQFVTPEQAHWPTTYYGDDSGVGLALNALTPGFRRIGLVGLGTGTLAAYLQPGDYARVYEINPEVKRLATSLFTYVHDCAGQTEIVLGDARLSLEKEPPQDFDLLALDAFSSDAIPVHLLTREAFEVYGRHVRTNGVIAVHVSNHFLDLEPVIINVADALGYKFAVIDYDETDEKWWLYSSTWILLSRYEGFLESVEMSAAPTPRAPTKKDLRLWTDDYTSLVPIMK
jgi:hypothetical protein